MAKNRLRTFVLIAGLLAVVTVLIAFNAINLNESFGNGPPYYARTTNMDKWVNPLPVLATVDAAGILVVAVGIFFLRRRR